MSSTESAEAKLVACQAAVKQARIQSHLTPLALPSNTIVIASTSAACLLSHTSQMAIA